MVVAKSQWWQDVASFADPLDVRQGFCPTMLHFLAWYNVLGALITLALQLGDAIFLRADLSATGFFTEHQVSHAFNRELLVLGLTMALGIPILFLFLWWLGRLRREWITRDAVPRIAAIATALLWIGLEVLGAQLAPNWLIIGEERTWPLLSFYVSGALTATSLVLGLLLLLSAFFGHRRRDELPPENSSA